MKEKIKNIVSIYKTYWIEEQDEDTIIIRTDTGYFTSLLLSKIMKVTKNLWVDCSKRSIVIILK